MSKDTERDLVEKLKSNNTTDIYNALLKIRKNYVRNQHKMKELQNYSVIEFIIPFMEHPKFCSISLSIIADGCLELSFVTEVIKRDGIKSLIRIMNSFVNDDILNKACRAIGNMAKFEIGFKAVHLMKPVSNIINFLSETNDVNCQQTAVRTLMYLGKCSKTRELIARENGIVYIAKLLHSSNVQVLSCSVKALANLTQNCSINCARQLLEKEFHKILVELHSHSEKSVRNHALISLKNLSSQEEIRSGLVKVGAIKLFTDVISNCESHEMSRVAALALCSCLDHIHMWSHNGTDRSVGLKALLGVLKKKQFQDIHMHVIASLITLTYESKITDLLLNLEILQILIEILKCFIENHKCKSIDKSSHRSYTSEKDGISSDHNKDKKYEMDIFRVSFSKSENDIPKDDSYDNYEHILKSSVSFDRSYDVNYSQKGSKWEQSLYCSSKTSDYSSMCSPYRICSPVQKYPASPEMSDVNSPTSRTSSGVLSPVSLIDENMPFYNNCWSPTVSTHSNSIVENEVFYYEVKEENVKKRCASPMRESSSPCPKTNEEIKLEESVLTDDLSSILTDDLSGLQYMQASSDCSTVKKINNPNCSPFNSKESQFCDQPKNNFEETSLNFSEILPQRKKMKANDINKCDSSESADPVSTFNIRQMESNVENTSCDKQSSKVKLENETLERQTLDHYVILFILQLSFHLEKKTNSQMADKFCFSVLIDYLCVIHNPSLKAEQVLQNLIKNRYCFEKLLMNGFVSELEEKMTSSTYFCVHRSSVKVTYSALIDAGRQEMESDYGIGTLSHVLVTSGKIGQFNAICAMSKLVTQKPLLYKLLFEASGLSLLLSFLSENNVMIRRKAVMCLCELYQSLTKQQKIEKCCFEGTCNMKSSSVCCYKESFLNVTFSVGGRVKILANREKICKNSDYFNALLQGHFRESNIGLVELQHISAENLSTIFHFLHGCGSVNCCPYITRIPFSVLLELLGDCEKFLLTNVKTFVEDRLCHHLVPSTIPKIYKQSKFHNSPALTKRTLHFFLNINTEQKDIVWNCFEEIINLECNLNILNDIEELLKSILLCPSPSITS